MLHRVGRFRENRVNRVPKVGNLMAPQRLTVNPLTGRHVTSTHRCFRLRAVRRVTFEKIEGNGSNTPNMICRLSSIRVFPPQVLYFTREISRGQDGRLSFLPTRSFLDYCCSKQASFSCHALHASSDTQGLDLHFLTILHQ